ncbi:PilW family protein [Phormidesmis priestleyi]|uniref:PilW family protein n=1 Tax=Phormidesmis priestleyi TaxID=268141 RepID=UPI00083B7E08|nr:prepilin-type N-terminal cleavage/methylation domain-containing protein [Phormidesmis priestleyi]
MARKWFKQGSQRLRLFSKGRKSAGFTLIELLVAMVIASIITSILLFLVVQLLQTSQRESARSDTQREMQMALDYIGRDVREAVYVYDGKCLTSSAPADGTCSGLLTTGYLPAAISAGANNLPVLAFWRVDPLPPKVDKICTDNAAVYTTPNAASIAAIGIIPCVSRRMYTLVVYSLNWDAGSPWSGKARIKRYQMPQYSYSAKTAAETTPGWLFPASGDVSFMTWPHDTTGTDKRLIQTPTSDPSNTQVLVDFVDQKGLSTSAANDAVCPAPVATAITSGYVLTPTSAKTPSADNNRGFYVCVKGGESKGNLNQEVSIFLQGNAAGRPGLQLSTSNVPISMQTRVMTRGALDKAI